MREYEVMVTVTEVYTKRIKAESQTHANEIAENEWSGETVDWNDGADCPPDWREVGSVSGEFEVI